MSINQWLQQAAETLVKSYGIDKTFASKVALLYAYLQQYGLRPQITSGYRSSAYQAELTRRYKAGDPSVVVQPAANSLHSMSKGGRPAALAIDIKTSDPTMAARIAAAVGVNPGLYFKTPDPVHFYA